MLTFRCTWNVMKRVISNIAMFLYNECVLIGHEDTIGPTVLVPYGSLILHTAQDLVSPLSGNELLPQWHHSRTSLHLPTALLFLAVGANEPGPLVGPHPSLALTSSHSSDMLSAWGWDSPRAPLLTCSCLGWCVGTWPLWHPHHIFSLTLKFFTQSTF